MALDQKRQDRLSSAADWLETVVSWVEAGVAFVLAAVILVAVVWVVFSTAQVVIGIPESLEEQGLAAIIKAVLDTFIIIELFRITTAYVRHRDVIPTVLETALVVAAREIVVIEAGANEPLAGLAVGATLVAIGLTWYLLRRGAPEIAKPGPDSDL